MTDEAEHNRSLMLGAKVVRDVVLSLAIAEGKLAHQAVWRGKVGWIGDMLQEVGGE